MKIIVGLGNPGKKYEKTRHNVGFMTLDRIVKRAQNSKVKTQNYNLKFKANKKSKSEMLEVTFGNRRVILAKPMTFMNKSGEAVKKIVTSYKLQAFDPSSGRGFTSLYLIHDDLDIPLGKYKIQFGKGPRVHKGVESVEKALVTKDFWRVRVGIENREEKLSNYQINQLRIKGKKISGEEYVLQEFTEEEKRVIEKVIFKVAEEIKRKLREGLVLILDKTIVL